MKSLTVKANWRKLYFLAENLYGRSVTELDADRAFARYLKVTGQEESK